MELRKLQYATTDAVQEHDLRERELAVAKAQPIDDALLDDFKTDATKLNDVLTRWKNAGHAYSLVSVNLKAIDGERGGIKEAVERRGQQAVGGRRSDEGLGCGIVEAQAKPMTRPSKKALPILSAMRERRIRKPPRPKRPRQKLAQGWWGSCSGLPVMPAFARTRRWEFASSRMDNRRGQGQCGYCDS